MSEPLIEKTPGYRVGQQFFPLLKDAQYCALRAVLGLDTDAKIAAVIVDRAQAIIKILEMGNDEPRPRKRRKDYGVRRKPQGPMNPTPLSQTK
jgi:hypothetical protein